MLLHEATVVLALSSRAAVLRMVTVVTRTATAIAVRLALPTAWRFVQRVVNEPAGPDGEGKR